MSKKKLIITAIVLVLILIIGGILAYFTDTETRHNKFKMGGANITVTEPNYPGDDNNSVPVVPGTKVAKDPIVTNVGDGEVYAFVEVTIPKEDVKIGNQQSSSVQELFTTQYISTPAQGQTPAVYTNGINPAWVLLSTTNNAAVAADPTANPPVEAQPASTTYVYAYGTQSGATITLTPLTNTSGNNATPAVFDQVTFVDVVEDGTSGTSIQGKDYEVTVTGYGIQTDGLGTTDAATIFGYAKNGN